MLIISHQAMLFFSPKLTLAPQKGWLGFFPSTLDTLAHRFNMSGSNFIPTTLNPRGETHLERPGIEPGFSLVSKATTLAAGSRFLSLPRSLML